MRIDDVTVEVRDANLNRVGQLVGADVVGAQFIIRFNNVGSWSLQLPATSSMVDLLRTPGYGIILTARGTVLFSGSTTSATLLQSQDDLKGVWRITGADDTLLLQDRLAYPQPANADVSTQNTDYDNRTGVAETVMKAYVDANLVSGPAVRAVTGLSVATDAGRGGSVVASARFTNMQELLYNVAQSSGIGYSVTQSGSGLVFDVYEPVDRSATISFDVDNGKLSSSEYAYVAPRLTRAIVGGAGAAEERLFDESTTTESVSAETTWGRRIEAFVDERGTDLVAELEQAGKEALVDEGKTRVTIAVTPSDNGTMLYGTDWNLGDKITVVADTIEAQAVVYEVGFSIQSDGVYLGATVGYPTPLEFESKVIATQNQHENRIGNLERNTTGFGVVTELVGGVDVEWKAVTTDPTYTGDPFTASYVRFGDMVHFHIEIHFSTVTNFGDGQYYVTLPHASRYEYMFRSGVMHDASEDRRFHVSGEVAAGSKDLYLYTTDRHGNRIYDFAFDKDEPVTLTTADDFDISGTYIIQ